MASLAINFPGIFTFALSAIAAAAMFAIYLLLRRRPAGARVRILVISSLCLLALMCGLGSVSKSRRAIASHGDSDVAAHAASPAGQLIAVSAPQFRTLRADYAPARPVYGHSIVKGGIHSLGQLRDVIATDPLAAQHYKGFDISKARFVTLDHNIMAYISYRVDGKGIYWTSKPQLILAGEQVITDGTNFIRVRCGNMISYAPQSPVETDDPTDTGTIVDSFTPFAAPPLATLTDDPLNNLPPGNAPAGTPSAACCSGGGFTPPPVVFAEPPAPRTPNEPTGPPTVNADEFHGRAALYTLLAGFLILFLVGKFRA